MHFNSEETLVSHNAYLANQNAIACQIKINKKININVMQCPYGFFRVYLITSVLTPNSQTQCSLCIPTDLI